MLSILWGLVFVSMILVMVIGMIALIVGLILTERP